MNDTTTSRLSSERLTPRATANESITELGLGVYTLADAALLVQADRAAINRWLFGYRYSHRRNDKIARYRSAALWQPQYSDERLPEKVIGFRDLLELRVVREFVRRGVPLLVVRHCLEAAQQLFGSDYPFTTRRFVTDGETIYLDAVRDAAADSEILNLRTRQYAFREIIKDSLYAGIEYEDGFARRWYPVPRSRAIVIDPAVQFGHPMIEQQAVPTASIYASYLAEGKQKAVVARLFELEPKQVDVAVRFEEKLRLAA